MSFNVNPSGLSHGDHSGTDAPCFQIRLAIPPHSAPLARIFGDTYIYYILEKLGRSPIETIVAPRLGTSFWKLRFILISPRLVNSNDPYHLDYSGPNVQIHLTVPAK